MNRRMLVLAAGAALVLSGSEILAQESPALGLTVQLDRPAPVYASRNDGLYLTIRTDRDALVSIWLLDPKGRLSRVVPDTPDGLPLSTRAGAPLRYPRTGVLRVEPPAGRYELRVSAEASRGGEGRGLTDADARLPRRDVREQKTVVFQVEGAAR